MKTKFIILLSFFMIHLVHAQKCNEWWSKKPPESSSNNYLYIISTGNSLQEAIIEGVVTGGYAAGNGNIAESEIRDAFRNQNGVVSIDQGSESTLKLGNKAIQYTMIDFCDDGGVYKTLMMFSKTTKEHSRLPKAVRWYYNPIALALSAAVPGTGQFYKKQKGRGFLFLTSTTLLGGAAYYFETQRSQASDDYRNAVSFDEREVLITDIERNRDWRNAFIAGAGIAYAINLIDAVAFKGRRFAYNDDRKVDLMLAYSYENKSPIAGIRWSFGK